MAAEDQAMQMGLGMTSHSHTHKGETFYMPGSSHQELNEQLQMMGKDKAKMPGHSHDKKGGKESKGMLGKMMSEMQDMMGGGGSMHEGSSHGSMHGGKKSEPMMDMDEMGAEPVDVDVPSQEEMMGDMPEPEVETFNPEDMTPDIDPVLPEDDDDGGMF
jgi:hypothetical protein